MLYYLKDTCKTYVFDENTRKLYRVRNGVLSLLLPCNENSYRITMPLSGQRFRVTIAELFNMMGNEKCELPLPSVTSPNNSGEYGNGEQTKPIVPLEEVTNTPRYIVYFVPAGSNITLTYEDALKQVEGELKKTPLGTRAIIAEVKEYASLNVVTTKA